MTDISKIISWSNDAIGKSCSDVVDKYGRLSLKFGLGEPAPLRGLPDRKRFEWTFGIFAAAWRVSSGHEILGGSLESEDCQELGDRLRSLSFGLFSGIYMVSRFNVRVGFSDGVGVEFMAVSCEGNIFT